MAKFGDLDQYFKPGLELSGIPPLLTKEYVLPLPSAELGLWCRRATQLAGDIDAATSDDEMKAAAERASELPPLPGAGTFEEQLLGDVLNQMIADKVADPYVQFCALTAYIWIVGGDEVAERFWKAGGHPEAVGPVPNRADRRANDRKTGTGAASATPPPGSTSGTSSRRRSRRGGGANGSRGRSS